MRWIHLSDLHIDPPSDGRSTEELRAKLLIYISSHRITADYLFLTGDYRNAKYPREDIEGLVKAAADFILDIAKAAEIEITNIYLIPGNHDLNRTMEKERIKNIRKGYDFADGKFRPEDLDFLLSRFTFFISLCQELKKRGVSSLWSDNLHPLHPYICHEDFTLLCLNTCIICNSKKDRHRLIIGNYDLYHSLLEIQREKPNQPIVILAHHGLGYLHDDEKKVVENLFARYPVKLYLCGDTHRPWIRQENQVLEVTMGCSVKERGSTAVFSVGKMKDSIISIEAYEWKADFSSWNPFTAFNKCFEDSKTKVITRMKPMLPDDNFTGRDTELEQIKDAIDNDDKIILLHGMSGIGKTELCRKFFRQCLTTESSMQKIGWISYRKTIKDSFWNQFPEIVVKKESSSSSPNICGPERAECKDINAYWEEVKYYFARQDRKPLLIIDNVDEIKDSEISLLDQLNCQVILTSCKQINGVKCIHITQLHADDCKKLYRAYSQDEDDTLHDIVIENIIELACGHPLLIELLAKLQYASGLTAEGLYQQIKNEGFDLSGITEDISYLHNPEINQEEIRDRRITEHIEKLFNISEIVQNPEEMRILQFFSLLSPGCFISMETAKKWMNLENLNTVNTLVKKGWLKRGKQNGISVLTIHPLRFMAICHMENPSEELKTMWIKNIVDHISSKADEEAVDIIDILSPAEAIFKKARIHNIESIDLLSKILMAYIENGEYQKALKYCEKLLKIEETVLGKQHIYIFKTYNTFGAIYDGLMQYTDALEWFKKGTEMCERILGNAHLDTAVSFCNVASTCLKLNMPEDAQEWVERAYAIVRLQPDKEYSSEAGIVYMTMGNICCRVTGHVSEAKICFKKAWEIYKTVFGEEHHATLAAYGNIALIDHACGESQKALDSYHYIREIYERKLGVKHPNTTYIYRNIGNVYRTEKRYDEALKWYENTVRIREEIYGEEHLHTAYVYNDIGIVYYEQGKYLKALKEFKKALPIYIKAVGKNGNDTKLVYHNIEEVYKCLFAWGVLIIMLIRVLLS